MTAGTIEDLKQFITALFVQEASETREAIKENHEAIKETRVTIQELEVRLSTKIDNLSSCIAEAMDAANDATDEQLKNHERRITRLERKTA